MTNEVATRNEAQPAATQHSNAVTPMEMLDRAIERGMDAETLQKLMDLKERHEADEARKAYVAAMAAFKAEPLRLVKDKHVHFQSPKGVTDYRHASLAAVVDAVVGAMGKHGLSHRWETNQQDGLITVTCVVTHELGHSERTTLGATADDTGNKNSIQQVGSTITYLQRYTLMAATGLAAHDMDDDGRSAGQPVETITESQVADLEAKIEEVGANREAFLKVCKVEDFSALPASMYKAALDKLEQKRKQAE